MLGTGLFPSLFFFSARYMFKDEDDMHFRWALTDPLEKIAKFLVFTSKTL